MRALLFPLLVSLLFTSTLACSDGSEPTHAGPPPGVPSVPSADDGGSAVQDGGAGSLPDGAADASPTPSTNDGAIDKAATCAKTFGGELTTSFGRLDGTVLAVIPPNRRGCPYPNSDHVTLHVTMGAHAYRVLVNVSSATSVDPRVQYFETTTAGLAGDPWSEGWHTGATLDYASSLRVHAASFTPLELDALAARIYDAIPVGAKISVYATGFDATGAHDVHRRGSGSDGAIVLDPDTSPRWLLFHFDNQTF